LICSSSNSEMGEIFHQNVQASLWTNPYSRNT
jgi:hypothetical protein